MNIQKISLKASFLSLYVENGIGLLFVHSEKKLYKLSSITVAFVCSIDDGLSETESIEEVSESCTVPYHELLSLYHEAQSFFSNIVSNQNYIDSEYPELTALNGFINTDEDISNKSYLVAETFFSISCANEVLFKQITELLQPIEVKNLKVHFQICITKSSDDNYFNIFCNNLLIEERLLILEVVPLLIDRMQILSFQHSDYYFCFHGSALQTLNGTLLLPGISGAGKSTLSAVLAAKGDKLYSDEMIVLDKYFNAKVLNLPIAIKSGSWDILSAYYPELRELPEFLRLDGRRLKYVWPRSFAKKIKRNEKINQSYLIVNPKFNSDIQVPITREKLSIIHTITMLIDSGYQVGVELNEVTLESLLGFIEKAYCYRLNYHTCTQAEYELKSLWENCND